MTPSQRPQDFNFKPELWVGWIMATATAAITMAAFAYATFETKEHAKEVKDDSREALRRVEMRLDAMLSLPQYAPARAKLPSMPRAY